MRDEEPDVRGDELLALMLTSTWSVLTGRRLRDVPVRELTKEELIEFWSDWGFARAAYSNYSNRSGCSRTICSYSGW